MAIQSFRRPVVADFFFHGATSRREGWVAVAKVVARKLDMLHYALKLEDLRSPPGGAEGRSQGFFSIRINDQWRVVFRWTASGPDDVDVIDYHG